MRLGLTSIVDGALWSLVEESRAFYARRTPGRGPACLEELLAARKAVPAPMESQPPPTVETVSVGDRSVPVRIHAPLDRPAAGVVLDIHAGGFYLGSAARRDISNRRLAGALGVAVVSVDYRLAPENPWPAAPDDCEVAALWLAEHAQERFGTTRLIMTGLSSGATLAMTTLVRLRDRGLHAFGGAVVQCGTYDLSAQTPAGRLIADEYFLSAYVGDAPDRTNPDVSPIFAYLQNLPPILMVIGSDDILLEDNLAMAARLAAAEVDVDLKVYPASPHAFTGHSTSMARAALDDIDAWLRDRVSA